MAKIELGKTLHCVETNTGKNLTGTLLLSVDGLSADIYSYDDLVHIDCDKPIYFITKNAQTVSFHSNLSSGTGTTRSSNIEVHHQKIISNIAIVGKNRWTELDKVKSVSFTVNHTISLMHHHDKIKSICTSKFANDKHWTIFNTPAKGMIIKAWYGAHYSLGIDAPKDIWPIFGIEFDEPQSIHVYTEFISNYVCFLSFCFGVRLTPKDIHIDRLSQDEMVDALEAKTYPGGHDVYYVWPETEIDSYDVWVGGSPVRVWDELELSAFQACLVAWMNRGDTWKNPYAMMMGCFALKRVSSAERLMKACRWFEDIPIASAKTAISAEDIDDIAAAATERAKSLGHSPEIRKRIAGTIRLIKAESTRDRLSRLVMMIGNRFGKNILPTNAVSHLRQAMQEFRGKAAHGNFILETEEEHLAFDRSTLALEALCYLLTALELPISDEGIERMRYNPLVRDYRDGSG